MCILGAPVSMTADLDVEFTQIVAKARQAYHSNLAQPWEPGSQTASAASLGVRLLLAGQWTRQWTSHELKEVRSHRLKMMRGIEKWYPAEGEEWPAFKTRCPAWSRG